jgi:hypothetical protein
MRWKKNRNYWINSRNKLITKINNKIKQIQVLTVVMHKKKIMLLSPL